jgi:predicted lactoylglutathione lyase
VAENIYLILWTEERFKAFTPKEICDASKSIEVLVCLSCESREKVDEMVRKAVAAGGTTYSQPAGHRIMVLCMGMGFRISMDISERLCLWNAGR